MYIETTNHTSDFSATLDYIFLSPQWQVLSVKPLPCRLVLLTAHCSNCACIRSDLQPGPNDTEPSDHLLLRATLNCESETTWVRFGRNLAANLRNYWLMNCWIKALERTLKLPTASKILVKASPNTKDARKFNGVITSCCYHTYLRWNFDVNITHLVLMFSVNLCCSPNWGN